MSKDITARKEIFMRAVTLGNEAHKGMTWSAGRPYTLHLSYVDRTIREYFPKDAPPLIMTYLCAAAWLHDSVEDTDMTLERIEQECGPEVRGLVWAVTDEPGANRKERHEKTYPKIKNMPWATMLKLADRIVNVEANADMRGGFFDIYHDEHPGFKEALYVPGQYEEMWDHLDDLLSDEPSKAAVKLTDKLMTRLLRNVPLEDHGEIKKIRRSFASLLEKEVFSGSVNK